MVQSAISIERIGPVVRITFTREERFNTLAKVLVDELKEALETLAQDPEVRALIVTGAGAKAFCAGADLQERRGMDDAQVRQTVHGLQALTAQLASFPRPVVCAMNGVAFGGGLEIALACDLRLAASTAKMGLTETRLGIIPGAGGTQRLPRLIGLGRARQMIFTGARLDAQTALAWGLVEDVCAPEDLQAQALALAEEIAQGAPLALEQAKFAINQGINADLSTGLAIERAAYDRLIPTQDRLEALEAFAQKRPPNFHGR